MRAASVVIFGWGMVAGALLMDVGYRPPGSADVSRVEPVEAPNPALVCEHLRMIGRVASCRSKQT